MRLPVFHFYIQLHAKLLQKQSELASCADCINPCYYGPTANIRTALDIDWKKGMTQTAATVGVGSQVVFKWAKSEFHNVYLLPNKADFDSCNFANAQELAKNDQNPFTYTPSSAGTFYFGCQVGNGFHCRTPQKLALTVTTGTIKMA